MSQPTTPRITGLQSVSTASAAVTAMPTAADANRRGRARMIRHTQGARRVFRLSVGIGVSDESIEWIAAPATHLPAGHSPGDDLLGCKWGQVQMPDTSMASADQRPAPTAFDVTSWCLAAASLLMVLWLHLLPALLAGFLVYELVHVIAPLLQRHLSGERSRVAAVVVLALLVVGVLTGAILGAIAFFHSREGSLPVLFEKMADVVEGSRAILPSWLGDWLPADLEGLHDAVAHGLRAHAAQLGLAGREAGRALAHIFVGMVVGAMISLRGTVAIHPVKPLARALLARLERLGNSFRSIVFAQVRIAAINAVLTAIYLVVLLPLFGVHLPLTKTLIAVTFIAGLLPIIGNLFSNTAIVIVSLAISPHVAIGSLVFLVAVHKLEYFLNAHIVGSHISARAWELLLAMLVMEAAFGLPGLVAAPIYYAYLKKELVDQGLV
nr:histidine kinase [uncultured bacterium]